MYSLAMVTLHVLKFHGNYRRKERKQYQKIYKI